MPFIAEEETNLKPHRRISDSLRRRYILIIVILGVIMSGGILAYQYYWWLPEEEARTLKKIQDSITEIYLIKSWPIFEKIKDQIELTKENTFLDIATQFHYLKDALEDTNKDIKEIEKTIIKISFAKDEIANLEKAERISELDSLLNDYFSQAEEVLNKLLEHQKFQKRMLDAYGSDLDEELLKYTKNYYRGGDPVVFILQTQRIVDLAEDALSRMNIIVVPEDDEEYYLMRKEHLEDLRGTFETLNEAYRFGKYELIEPNVIGMTLRNENRSERVKLAGQKYINNSKVAKGFSELEDLENQVNDQYNFFQDELDIKKPKKIEIEEKVEEEETRSLRLVSPNGGESLCLGDDFIIQWKSEGLRFVKLAIRQPASALAYIGTYPTTFNETQEPGTGMLPWKVGETLAGMLREGYVYEIVIFGSDGSTLTDASDNFFSIIRCEG